MARKITFHQKIKIVDPEYFWYLAIILLAIFLRLLGLNKGLWLDETLSIKIIRSQDFYSALRFNDHPPLYFILLRGWSWFNTNEAYLRLFSVLFGVGTVVVVLKWMRSYSKIAGILAGLICATHPILLRFSQEIRGYSLLLFSTALAFYFCSRLIKLDFRLDTLIGLCISLIIAVATHMIGLFVLLSTIGFILVSIWLVNKTLTIPWRRLLLTYLVPTLLFVFFYFHFLIRIPTTDHWWVPPLSLYGVAAASYELLGLTAMLDPSQLLSGMHNIPISFWMCLVAEVFLIGWLMISLLGRKWQISLPLAIAALVYWLLIITYSAVLIPIFLSRTLLPGMIPFIGFLALQLNTIRGQNQRSAAILILIAICSGFAIGWGTHQAYIPEERWREAVNFLRAEVTSKDQIIVYPGYVQDAVTYYAPEINLGQIIPLDLGDETQMVCQNLRSLNLDSSIQDGHLFMIIRSINNSNTDETLLICASELFGTPAMEEKFDEISVYGLPK